MTETVFRWSSASVTDVGKVRQVNEDACLALPEKGLWVVADGMGGHDAGDVASRMIVERLSDIGVYENPADFLDEVEDRLLDVNLTLFQTAAMSTAIRTIGSTVVALLAFGHHCVLVWAGDSRVYRLRAGELQRLTVDHSQVEEMVQTGELRAEDAETHPLANVVTRAVGGTEDLQLDVDLREIRDGDRYLLCSDGLYKELSDKQIVECLGSGDSEAACATLLEAVLEGEASDNVTVAVVDFLTAS